MQPASLLEEHALYYFLYFLCKICFMENMQKFPEQKGTYVTNSKYLWYFLSKNVYLEVFWH